MAVVLDEVVTVISNVPNIQLFMDSYVSGSMKTVECRIIVLLIQTTFLTTGSL
jgi:hypothetical protein